jgi:subtilisin family serine protease
MTAGADIKATLAWDETQGDANTVIAIVDTGVDMSHAELKNKVVSKGYDFVNGDSDATDDNSHGTWVAGIAAAETNNNEGIAGVAWSCKVLPVKVMDADGNGYYDQLIEGIIWAADHGAKVINISAGGDADDPSLKAACKYAYDKNVVVVAAAGNDGTSVSYPAAYDDYVLAVAATDYNDARASFSNPGPQVDVAAPGVWILGPAPQWYVGPGNLPYFFGSGTSGASPEVAGLAALLFSHKPWLTQKQIMDIIRYTADDVNKAQKPGQDDDIGYGRINMERALVPYKLTR